MLKTAGFLTAAALAVALASANSASAQPRYYYGDDCHQQNAAAGAVLGAIAGGIIGNQFGHGRGRTASTVGGVVLGGMAGSAIASDVDCDDRPYAFKVYDQGFAGPIGQRYEWRHGNRYGYFMPTREFENSDGYVCRDFEEGVWRNGAWSVHNGTACDYEDGWHFM